MNPYLAAIRNNLRLGMEPSRTFDLREKAYLRMVFPDWALPANKDSRAYWRLIFESRSLVKHGRVCWGHLVQANSLLFEPGDDPCPGLIVYSPDPEFENDLAELQQVASALFDYKGKKYLRPSMNTLASITGDEIADISHYLLPQKLTNGRTIYANDIFIFRAHLPINYLAQFWLPILIMPERCRNVMAVPSYFWPQELIELWEQ